MTPTATHYKTTRTYPELPKLSQLTEQEQAYRAALELVARIDEDLTRGVRHYRTKAGVLLSTLDEVVRAIIADDLLWPEEVEAEALWVRPVEVTA
jgi:DNA-binding ferritin-like protein